MDPAAQARHSMIRPLEKRLMLDASLPAIAGNVLWLDAADSTTIIDADGDNAATGTGGSNNGFAGAVATWRDKSTSGFHVSAPTPGERPSYSNTLNGRNVITFDGTADRLINAGAVIPGDDFTAFVVFNRTTATARDAVFEMGGGGSRNGLFVNDTGSGRINYYMNGTFYNFTPAYTTSTYTLTSIVQNGTAVSGFLGATQNISATSTLRASTTGLYIADDSTSGDQLQGNIAEILIYDRDLTADERHDVETYLAGKWGLTISNAAPTVNTNTGFTLDQGTGLALNNTHLSSSDTDNTDTSLIYTLTDLADYGSLTNTNTLQTLGVGDTFTQSDLNNGYITYTHNNSFNFSDSFSFTVTDQYSTTAVTSFAITVNPVNTAPQFEGWSLVSSENFEGGATGWSNNLTTSTAGLTEFLGRFSQNGGIQNVFKTYTLSGTQDQVIINFDMYEIDSWDGESFRIFVDDVMVFNQGFTAGGFQNPVDGTVGSVSYRVMETTPFNANFVFGTWSDQTYRFTLTINTTAASVKLGFSSTLDQGITDEAFGIDNVSVYEVGTTTTVGPFDITENSVNGTVVGEVRATDAEGDTISYAITGGTGAAAFAINASTGVITVANSALLDYESVTSYTLDIELSDDGTPAVTRTQTITVNLLNINENTAPSITTTGPFSLAENAALNTVITTMSATDAQGNTITWSITAGNTDNIFAINGTTGALRLSNVTRLNHEWDSSYTLTIQAQDNGFGNLTSTRNIVINIQNINEAPTFNIPQSFLNLNPYLSYSAVTGNFYQYVDTTVNFTTANAAANSSLLNGVAGHLVTVTTAAEQAFVRALGGNSIWINGSDVATEGTWRFTSGPESTQIFSQGSAAQNGFYTNWLAGQPNGAANEHYLEMQASGLWNDVTAASTRRYVIEWQGSAVLASFGQSPYSLNENPANGQSVGFAPARDPDSGDTITYSITGGTGASAFAINSTTGEITVSNPSLINYELATSYTLNLRAQDAGGLFGTTTVTININDVNETPVLNVNTGTSANEGSSVIITSAMLSSSDVDAPPDSALIYSITSVTSNGTLHNTNTGLDLGLGDTFTQGDINNGYIRYTHDGSETISDSFGFTVSDGSITIPAQSFALTINPVNDAPVLDGWTLVASENFESGATGWAINTTATSNPYFTQHLGRFSQDGGVQTNSKTYTFSGTQDQVVISFDFYEIDSWENEFFRIFIDDVQVINQSFNGNTFNTPADGSNGSVSWTVQELTPFLTNVGHGTSNDQIFRYTLTISTNAASLKLGFGSTLNEANTNEAWGIDNIEIFEVGSGGTAGPFEVAENSANGTVVGRVTSRDAENDTLSYSITGGTGSAAFSIDSSTGVITVANSSLLNFEATSSFTLNIEVRDNGTPNLTDTMTVQIEVLNIPENTAPVITLPAGPFSVAENAAVNTVVGTVSATDAEANTITYSIVGGNTYNIFSINGAGQIRISNTAFLNHEFAGSYNLSVRATDNGFGTLMDTETVTINILNVNEGPSFDPVQRVLAANPDLLYNATANSFYRFVPTAAIYTAATANAASQMLNGVAGYVANVNSATENAFLSSRAGVTVWIGGSDATVEGEWRYTDGPEAGQLFWLGSGTGSAQNGNYVGWTGSEPNNSGGNEDYVELRTTGAWNDVSGTNLRAYFIEWNAATVIAGMTNGPYTIAENSSLGTNVGSAIAADPDSADPLTYSITGGTGAGVFSINAATGALSLLTSVNYELQSSYTLDLRVQDAGGLFDTISVSVTVSDQNDAPTVLNLTGNTVDENVSSGTLIGMLSTADEDISDTHTYSITLNPGGKFAIVGNELRTLGSIDYEQNQSLTVRIMVDDGNGGTREENFVIGINDLMDTFTPPPATGGGGEISMQIPSVQTPQNSPAIRFLNFSSEFFDRSGFFGQQILRENLTFLLQSLEGESQMENSSNTFEGNTIFFVPSADSQRSQENINAPDNFTNIRNALGFLQEMEKMKEHLGDDFENGRAGLDGNQDRLLPVTDRRFVDVMLYHEERAAKLRGALMGDTQQS